MKRRLSHMLRRRRAELVIALCLGVLCLTLGSGSFVGRRGRAQDRGPVQKNPYAGQLGAIEKGRELYATNCGFCHGKNGAGGSRGSNLTTGKWKHGETDAALFRNITLGIAGTAMPAHTFAETETWQIVAFLRSLSRAERKTLPGDVAAGEQVFLARCAACHMVGGRGGRLGPDLSQLLDRQSLDFVIESIRHPDQSIAKGFQTITVIERNGRRIVGVRKNEDTFSLQMMNRDEQLLLLAKENLRSITDEQKSLMPAFPAPQLSNIQLQNLLAWLNDLQSPQAPTANNQR